MSCGGRDYKIAKRFSLECLILCDTSHRFERESAQTLVFSKGGGGQRGRCPDEPIAPGGVVVTQDYALAAICLARGALALSQGGMAYTADNIDTLLLA